MNRQDLDKDFFDDETAPSSLNATMTITMQDSSPTCMNATMTSIANDMKSGKSRFYDHRKYLINYHRYKSQQNSRKRVKRPETLLSGEFPRARKALQNSNL